MDSTTVAVDIAKSVFEIAVSRRPGKVAERHRVRRSAFMPFFGERQPCTVVMEACGSAHHWGRRLQEMGHRVVLLPPHLVQRYRGQDRKTDRADAKALLEAFRNEEIHPVPVKTIDGQALAALHRMRAAWFTTRTARINTVRGLLREFGLVIPVGAHRVVAQTRLWLEDEASALPASIRPALRGACTEIRELERHIDTVEHQLEALSQQLPDVARLRQIPGIGPLTSTALVAFVGDARRFANGRRFASYLGLTPRERSSGLARHLGGISKRGDRYLRMLLTHGARSVLFSAQRKKQPARIHRWVLELRGRKCHNVSAIAMANKLARIAWAIWARGEDFQPDRGKRAA